MSFAQRPHLSILIVNYNTRDHLHACLRSLKKHPSCFEHEVIVIDNASSDQSADMVAELYPHCRLMRFSENLGYGVAVNRGVHVANGNLLMFMNPDIEVNARAIDTLVDFALSHPRAGVVGPRLLLGDGRPQPSARRFPSASLLLLESSRLHLLLPAKLRGRLLLCNYSDQTGVMKVPWISGACHLVPRSVWERVGPLTEETFCGFDDFDYCYRAWKLGYEVWFCGSSSMTHRCSVSVKKQWKSWEIEQVAIYNMHIVLLSHWPRWRVKVYTLAELLTWVVESTRHAVIPRVAMKDLGERYSLRLRKRLRLTLRLLLGLEKPIRRFQPRHEV